MQSVLLYILYFFAIIMLPFIVYESYHLIINPLLLREKPKKPVQGRRILAVVTTVGKNPEVVNDVIFKKLKSYDKNIKTAVVIEYNDKNEYNCDYIIRVPENYKTKNNSKYKSRALQYFSEWLKQNNFGKETYVLHLDDDSYVEKKYIDYIYGMEEEAGQGILRVNGLSNHPLTRMSDYARTSSCMIYCSAHNHKHKPLGVHGEGLAVRADVEIEIGWDFPTTKQLIDEDYLFGQTVAKKYRFGFIPSYINIIPPFSTKDFYKQRRRWLRGFVDNASLNLNTNLRGSIFFLYQYLMGWVVPVGFVVWMIILFTYQSVPLYFTIIFSAGLLLSLIEYEYGLFKSNYKYKVIDAVLLLFLLIPIQLYQSGTFFYSIFTRVRTFDVIKKNLKVNMDEEIENK